MPLVSHLGATYHNLLEHEAIHNGKKSLNPKAENIYVKCDVKLDVLFNLAKILGLSYTPQLALLPIR